MSYTAIETMLWHIERELMSRYGVDQAAREIAPLKWYIYTGRASVYFLRLLYEARPVLIARDLHKGGSDSEVICRIFHRIKYHPEA